MCYFSEFIIKKLYCTDGKGFRLLIWLYDFIPYCLCVTCLIPEIDELVVYEYTTWIWDIHIWFIILLNCGYQTLNIRPHKTCIEELLGWDDFFFTYPFLLQFCRFQAPTCLIFFSWQSRLVKDLWGKLTIILEGPLFLFNLSFILF